MDCFVALLLATTALDRTGGKPNSISKIVTIAGPPAVQQVYPDTLDGRLPPDERHILSLAE
jgi:hypothetical protein